MVKLLFFKLRFKFKISAIEEHSFVLSPGKVYAVIHQRHGDVIDDEMQQEAVGCSNMYTVNANIPVVESFGFVDDLRKQTCGYANPQLTFSHWQVCARACVGLVFSEVV